MNHIFVEVAAATEWSVGISVRLLVTLLHCHGWLNCLLNIVLLCFRVKLAFLIYATWVAQNVLAEGLLTQFLID